MSVCSVLAGTDLPAGDRYKHVRVRSLPAVLGRQRPHQGGPCQQALKTDPGFEETARLVVVRGLDGLLERLALTLSETPNTLSCLLVSKDNAQPLKDGEPAAPPIRSRRMLPARDGRHQAHRDVLVACRSDLIGGAAGPTAQQRCRPEALCFPVPQTEDAAGRRRCRSKAQRCENATP